MGACGETPASTLSPQGAMVMLTAACKTFGQLMALRALQGIFECTIGWVRLDFDDCALISALGTLKSTVSPPDASFLLMLGAWYTQQEHASRALIFMSANYGLGIICDIVIYFMGSAAKKNPTGIEAWQLIGLFIGGWTVLVSGGSGDTIIANPQASRSLSSARPTRCGG